MIIFQIHFLLVVVIVTVSVLAGAVVVCVTTLVEETVVVTAFGVVVVEGVDVISTLVVYVMVKAYVVDGTGFTDLVPCLVVQSCCDKAETVTNL